MRCIIRINLIPVLDHSPVQCAWYSTVSPSNPRRILNFHVFYTHLTLLNSKLVSHPFAFYSIFTLSTTFSAIFPVKLLIYRAGQTATNLNSDLRFEIPPQLLKRNEAPGSINSNIRSNLVVGELLRTLEQQRRVNKFTLFV